MKSFRPKDGDGAPPGGGRNPSRDFHGEKRRNDTHASTTDGDARLGRKGPGMAARLCFIGHVLIENRSGLVVADELTRVSGHAERLAALAMLDRLPTTGPATRGADRGFAPIPCTALSGDTLNALLAVESEGVRVALDLDVLQTLHASHPRR